ncbi:MAG: Mrp/NBP35 family ATP-binding protein [Planctomycetota bacterium]
MFGKKKDERSEYEQQAHDALKKIKVPGSQKDPVTLGFIKKLKVDASRIEVVVDPGTPSAPLRSRLLRDVTDALNALGWGLEVAVSMPDAPASASPPKTTGKTIKYIVAVASGKGGVGKSTVAVNLAFSLQQSGASVGILDADIYGPSVPHMLGVAARKPKTIEQGGKARLVPVEKDGVKMMSMGFLVEPDRAVIWRGPMIHGALKQFFEEVEWGNLDYLIVDLPPGTGDAQLTMVQQVPVDGAVIVTTPQDVAMIDARKAFNMFQDTNVPVLGIVENMSVFSCPECGHDSPIFGEGGAERWAKQSGCEFLGRLPIELKIREHGDDGTPAVTAADTPPAVVKSFASIAAAVRQNLESKGEAAAPLEL